MLPTQTIEYYSFCPICRKTRFYQLTTTMDVESHQLIVASYIGLECLRMEGVKVG